VKNLIRVLFAGFAALFLQSSWAQNVGPFYVSYTGYCNVKTVYLDSTMSYVWGTETGCSAVNGASLSGTVNTSTGMATVSMSPGSYPSTSSITMKTSFFEVYNLSNLSQIYSGSYDGSKLMSVVTAGFTLRSFASNAQQSGGITISTEMPNLELTKHLPPLGAPD
jgi:hypothetical protein